MKKTHLIAASLLAMSLVLPACSSDALEIQRGDPADVPAVLAAMGLDGSPDSLFAYGAVDITGADAVFSDVTLTAVGEDNVPLKVATLTVRGMDMTDAGATFGELVFDGISVTVEDGSVYSIEKSILRAPNGAAAAYVSGVLGMDKMSGDLPTPPKIEEIAFGQWSVEGLSLVAKDDTSDFELKLASFDVRNVEAGMAKTATVSGFDFNVTDPKEDLVVTGSIGAFSFEALNFGLFVNLFENLDSPEDFDTLYLGAGGGGPLEQGYDKAVISDFKLDIGGVKVDMPKAETFARRDKEGRVTDVKSPDARIAVTFDRSGKFGTQAADGMAQVGYDSITMVIGGENTWDPATDIGVFKDTHITFENMMSFRFDGSLGNLSKFMEGFITASASEDPNAMLAVLSETLNIRSFGFEIADASLFDRLLGLYATSEGMTLEEARGQALAVMTLAAPEAGNMGIDKAIVTDLITATTSFVQKPGILTIRFEPADPITMETFADPATITKESLGFSATYKEN
jgi:hypothetical protein